MPVKKYKTPKALLDALNHRLRATAMAEGVEANRLRRQVAFDRLLARIFQIKQSPWLLKGGYAMELRMQKSRATKDIDLALFESDLHHFVEKKQSKNSTKKYSAHEQTAPSIRRQIRSLSTPANACSQ